MSTVKICDKCKNIGAYSKFTLVHDQIHNRYNNEWKTREKTTYDLCDKCAMEIAKLIDPSVDAIIMHVDDEE